MSNLASQHFAAFFPIFFVTLWLVITTVLGVLSGWFRLMEKYPDQSDNPVLRIRGQSGTMGMGVGMKGMLTLTACTTGLRVGMLRLFGPFCRDFFVPWESVRVIRTTTLIFWPVAKLQFGDPVIGTLSISADVADRLARAAPGCWPEPGPFPEEKRGDRLRRLLTQWAIAPCAAALFFTLAPMALAPSGSGPPILVAVLFPAIVFGVALIVKFLYAES